MSTAEIRATCQTSQPRDRAGWLGLGVLLAISLGLCVWVSSRAESLVYDSSVFIRYAKELADAREGVSFGAATESPTPSYLSVIARHEQHPGYPILIERAHAWLTMWYEPAKPSLTWIASARGVSVAGYLILIAAVFVWVRGMLDPWSALIAATAVAASPPLVTTSANGLSDSPALACLAISAHYSCRLLRKPSILDASLAGIAAGLGYLIRPEAMQFALIAVGMLACLFVVRSHHRLRLLACLVSLSIALGICVLPYMVLRGSPLTKKAHLVYSLFDQANVSRDDGSILAERFYSSDGEAVSGGFLASPHDLHIAKPSEKALGWDKRYPRHSLETGLSWQRYCRGFYLYMAHLSASFGFVFAVPALVGFTWLMPSALNRMDLLLVYVTAIVNALFLPLFLYCLSGYVGSRHVMSEFVLVACFVGLGSLLLCEGIRGGISRAKQALAGSPVRWPISAKSATFAFVVGSAAILAIVSSRYRINADLAGCDTAGEWLRTNVNKEGVLFDLIYLPSFYADREKQNRWRHPGWCSFEALETEIQAVGKPVYLIVSDMIVRNISGEDHISATLKNFHCDERAAIPLGPADREIGYVRIFYVTPLLADAERSTSR